MAIQIPATERKAPAKIDVHFRVSQAAFDIASLARDFGLCNTKSSIYRSAIETSMFGVYKPQVVQYQIETIKTLFETTDFSDLVTRYFNTKNSNGVNDCELINFFKEFRKLLNFLPTFWYNIIVSRLSQSQEYRIAERISWRVEQFDKDILQEEYT